MSAEESGDAEHFRRVSAKSTSTIGFAKREADAETREPRGHELSICLDVVNHLYFGRHPLGGPTPFAFEVSSAGNPFRLSDIYGRARPSGGDLCLRTD